jgi:two-component system copper resistance phosphate regulon response regulator CusR
MRILIVEDEIKLAHAVKRALELQKHAVDAVFDGEAGFDLAVAENYDVLILDVMLPSKSGIQICSDLRKKSINTPILILTARGQIADKTAGLDAGADDYMVKPFSFEELFSRVRALGRRANKSSNPLLQAKDLTLDPTTFKVQRAGRTVLLSTKEFAVLEYLLRNKNVVLTKEQIVNHVWNYDANILPTTVEVHVKNLRDKIEKPFTDQLIFTIRGFGYEVRD